MLMEFLVHEKQKNNRLRSYYLKYSNLKSRSNHMITSMNSVSIGCIQVKKMMVSLKKSCGGLTDSPPQECS